MKAGGALMSSQVELDGPDAKNGFVGLAASMEVSLPAVQTILYDIEAGMPYLFVDKLSIQSPEVFGEPGRMRMTIEVAGNGGHQSDAAAGDPLVNLFRLGGDSGAGPIGGWRPSRAGSRKSVRARHGRHGRRRRRRSLGSAARPRSRRKVTSRQPVVDSSTERPVRDA